MTLTLSYCQPIIFISSVLAIATELVCTLGQVHLMGCDALIAFPGSEYQFWHLDVSKCPCTRRSYRGRLWYAQVTVGKREAMPVAVLAEAYHLEDVLWNYELVNPEAMRAKPSAVLVSLLKGLT